MTNKQYDGSYSMLNFIGGEGAQCPRVLEVSRGFSPWWIHVLCGRGCWVRERNKDNDAMRRDGKKAKR